MLLGAAWTDFREKRILNNWLLIWAAAGIWCEKMKFLTEAGLMLFPVLILFRFRFMGAGDGKLMLLIAGYLGFWEGLAAIWSGLLCGAVWSAFRFFRDGNFQTRLSYCSAYFMCILRQKTIMMYENFSEEGDGHRIPLAVCLAAGVYLYLLYRWLLG